MANTADVTPASKEILEVIKNRHRASSQYTAFTMQQVLSVMAQIADMLTIVLTLAAAITLIVSGVGIMNSMLANVQSRLREIGIRKALGATSHEIRLQFLTEAVFLSLAGGIVGTIFGLAIPLSVRFLTPFEIPVSIWSAVVALGTLHARRSPSSEHYPQTCAARLDPVQTLKYE